MGAIPINPDKAALTKAIRYVIGTGRTVGKFIGTGMSLIELTDRDLVEILRPSHGTVAFHENGYPETSYAPTRSVQRRSGR
jgi:hypothetical protein